MATYAQHHGTTGIAGLRDRLTTAFGRFQDNRARRAVFRRTVAELSALSSRELDDLGICRTMITRLAHEAAWGSPR